MLLIHVKVLYSASNQSKQSKDINLSKNEGKNTISRNPKPVCQLSQDFHSSLPKE